MTNGLPAGFYGGGHAKSAAAVYSMLAGRVNDPKGLRPASYQHSAGRTENFKKNSRQLKVFPLFHVLLIGGPNAPPHINGRQQMKEQLTTDVPVRAILQTDHALLFGGPDQDMGIGCYVPLEGVPEHYVGQMVDAVLRNGADGVYLEFGGAK